MGQIHIMLVILSFECGPFTPESFNFEGLYTFNYLKDLIISFTTCYSDIINDIIVTM